jgi:alkyl hydroperoxide reductase subunit AhpC
MARPSEYNYELCIEVCKEVANGLNIKTVLASKDEYPHFSTWCDWKRTHNELNDLYVRSIQDKAESVDEEIDSVLADVKLKKIDYGTARVLIDTLKWKAAKYYPKMFGDKVDLTSGGEKIQSLPPIFSENPLVDKTND